MQEKGKSIGITQAMSRLDGVQNSIQQQPAALGEQQQQRRSRRDSIGAWGRLRDIPRMTQDEATSTQTRLDEERPTVSAEESIDIVDISAIEQNAKAGPTGGAPKPWAGRA